MSQFLPPEGTPPPAPEPFDVREAATALIHWLNGQGISRADALKTMSVVAGKIIADTTRPDAIEINEALDQYVLKIAHSINERLYQIRSAARLDIRRRNQGGGK